MKKKVNIILIIAVLLLWGSVIYKALSNYFINDKNFSAVTENYDGKQFKIAEKDTFTLAILDRDPFLNKSFFVKKDKPRTMAYIYNKLVKKNIIPVKNTKANFPLISYFGYIKSKEKKDELIIVKINNQLKKLRINETFEGLTVKKKFKDSIYISNNLETRTFVKNKP